MAVAETITVASLTRILQPLIKDIYEAAKKAGVRGLQRWEQRSFPAKLAKRVKAIDQVRTIWKPEGPISLQDFFHPPKLLVHDVPTRIARINEIPSGATIIEGIVGQGKSVFLRSLAIEELAQNDGKWLPIFLELKDLTPKMGLRATLLKTFDSLDIDVDEEALNYIFKSGKFALLLDGFDEIEESMVKETYGEMEFLAQKYPDLKIIVSCRPGHEIQKSTVFQKLSIAPLSSAEYQAFLDRLKVDPKKSLALRQSIRSSPSKISGLITTPLMLTLVVLVYESESEIPETLPEFFDRLFQVVFTKHDRQKANFNRRHRTGLSERKLQNLFETFSFMALQSGHSRTLTEKNFIDTFDLAISYSEGIKCEADDFRSDMTKSACLMLEDGIDSITYLHKSILEYYAAAFVKRLSDENARLFYEMAGEKGRSWYEVLIFLKSIDPVRYAKNYVLPLIKWYRDEIVEPCRSVRGMDALKIISKYYPDLGAYYGEEEGVFSVKAIGGYKPRPGEELGELGSLLLDAVGSAAVSNVKNLVEIYGPVDISQDKLGHKVSAGLIFGKFGTASVEEALAIFERRLDKKEEEANAVVNSEEKKKLLFTQPKET